MTHNQSCPAHSPFLLQQCCECCTLGLRIKSEGQSCESNPNLGYSCTLVMLSCCEGEDQLIHAELKRHPEPLPTVTPEKRMLAVSEIEDHNEALSISNDAELSNSLPGDDLDECLVYPGELCQHLCINTVGSYKCSCFPRFTLQDDGLSCNPDFEEDGENTALGDKATLAPEALTIQPVTVNTLHVEQDKCKAHVHTLLVSSINQRRETDGSSEGNVPRIFAWLGILMHFKILFVLDNGPCKHTCNSSEGRIVCSCLPGFALMADEVSCEDINECVTDTHTCKRGEHCVNSIGSFTCLQQLSCQSGYELKDGECVAYIYTFSFADINECTSLSEPCKPGFNCINTVGSYTCQRNLLVCSRGHHSNEDGTRCVDVDECQTGVHRCGEGQICHNLPGAYRCDCKMGYQYDAFSRTCIDIDECSQSAGILCTFRCINVPGSYQCACPEQGYTMAANGRTCRDIDECAMGTHNCSSAESCYNIQGSFRCLLFECPPNYRKVSDMRCERINCFNYLDCQSTPLRITYYQLNFQTNIVVPAHIFRIGPSPAYAGDNIILTINKGNEENYFSTRKLNSYTGIVYLQRQVREPKDFLLDVEMKLWRQGTYTTFLAKIYIFITSHAY
ncbi:hypothetical protein lerEdw1_015794 [Lerista edwardsae]|nr:hypothetical protein lerEdw1_015794 [Lerista edwardsae]